MPICDEGCVFFGHCDAGSKECANYKADLLAELGQNKEVVMFGTPSKQYDATEPRYEVKIIGPERLIKRLLDAIHNAA